MLFVFEFFWTEAEKLIPSPENVDFQNTLIEKPFAFLLIETSDKWNYFYYSAGFKSQRHFLTSALW